MLDVQGRGRFVEQQHVRFLRERHRNTYPLSLTPERSATTPASASVSTPTIRIAR
ncbi:hypothetical protein QP157_21340 [Sphingomonas sp. LR61]|uniref:hypothetical protein n=1 Tax=Sphingomonas sp. LR61 TaxID=3050234 RepID=UPI002FE28210